MKKLVSLILTVVLLTAILVIPGTNVSANTYTTPVMEGKLVLDLNFEGDAPYGVAAHRGNYNGYSDGQLIIKQGSDGEYIAQANGAYFFLGADGSVGANPTNTLGTGTVNDKDELFIFKAATKYRVTFKYKYLKGSYGTGCNNAELCSFDNPDEAYSHADNANHVLKNRVTIISETIPNVTWTPDADSRLTEDTDWVIGEYIFVTKSEEEGEDGFYAAMQPGNQGGYKLAAYEYIKVEVLEENTEPVTSQASYSSRGAFYDMDETEVPQWENANGAPGSVSSIDDSEHKNVLIVEGTAVTSRGGFAVDDFKVVKDRKYYVAFDAKSMVDNAELVFGITDLYATGSGRWFISGNNDQSYGVEIFAGGEEVKYTSNGIGVTLTTDWKTYGFIVDTDIDGELYKKAYNYNNIFWDKNLHWMFGATTTVYFDNIRVVELTEMPDVIDNTRSLELVQRSIRKAETNEDGEYVSAGLRVKGSIDRSVRDSADEIGFIVLPSILAAEDEEWFDMNKKNPKFKTAVCYQKDKYGKVIKDVVYSDDFFGDYVEYQMILTGLSKEVNGEIKTSYNIRYAFVMYVKTGNKYTYYGLSETSYNEVQALYDVYDITPPNKVS